MEAPNAPSGDPNQKISDYYGCTIGHSRVVAVALTPFRVMQRDGPLVWMCARFPGAGLAPKISYLECYYAFADSLVDHVTGAPAPDPIIADQLP